MIIKGCKDTKAIDAIPSEELKEYHRNSYVQVNLRYDAFSDLRQRQRILVDNLLKSVKLKEKEENEKNTPCT